MSMFEKEHMPSRERLAEILVGKSIVAVDMSDDDRGTDPDGWGEAGPYGWLYLSDGSVLKVWGNDGGCACSAGCYPLASLSACDNIITNVEVEERPSDDESYRDGYYRIFVYAEDQRINIASFEGDDGNGYYGTGWWLSVIPQNSEGVS